MAAAGRWTSPCGTSPARSPASRCWKLLGGLSNRVRAYASSGTLRDPARWRMPPSVTLPGLSALKLRFHRGDWRDDVKALEAVRARVGNRLELMVDCNQGWRHALGHRSALER